MWGLYIMVIGLAIVHVACGDHMDHSVWLLITISPRYEADYNESMVSLR